jgi:hypothetical protein
VRIRGNKYNALQRNKYLAGWPLWNGPPLLGGMAKSHTPAPPGRGNIFIARPFPL